MTRPTITENAELAFAPFGAGIKPDGTDESMRIVIKPDGFHFEAYDFDDLVLPSIALHSPGGSHYVIGFNDTGDLLINGIKFVDKPAPLVSPNGTKYKIVVDDTGLLTTEKEVI